MSCVFVCLFSETKMIFALNIFCANNFASKFVVSFRSDNYIISQNVHVKHTILKNLRANMFKQQMFAQNINAMHITKFNTQNKSKR